VGSALLFQSFLRITDVSPGLDPRNVLTFGVTAPSSAGGRVQPAVLFHDFARQLSALPGAEEVAYANVLPLEGTGGDYLFSVEGRTGDAQEGYDADVRKISPGYFSALRIPLLHGRAFTDADSTDGAEPVVVINDAVAQMVWHGADPVGEHIWVGKPMGPAAAEAAPRRVVGVVGSVREDSLAEGVSAVIYFPFARSDRNSTAVVFAVRSSQDPRSLIPEVRRTLRQMNSSAPLGAIRTMEEIIAASVTGRRFQTILLGLFGGMAVLIAIVGVYGVISYSVAQRTREVGIRMSLGAARGDVLRLILAQGLRLGAGGIAIGIVASLALTRLLQNLLYGITATDLATFLAVSVGLFAAILCACWVPARRATRVDPIVALRYE